MRCVLGLVALSVMMPRCVAAPPALTNLAPRGAERGKTVEILVQGANLTPATQLIVPFKARIKPAAKDKPAPNQMKLEITVDPATPVGIYPVRLFNDSGVSGLLFFGVDAFPNVQEVEDNTAFDKAPKMPFPCVVTGQCGGADVDYYRFEVKKGQRVVVETEAARIGSGVVPQIRVTDDKGRFIAADDTQRFRGDCRLWFTAPADGAYVVEFSDSRYRGGNPPDYRLKIGDYDASEEVFPLGGKRGDKAAFTLRGGTLTGEAKTTQSLTPALSLLHSGFFTLELPGHLKPGWAPPALALGRFPEVTYQPMLKELTPPLTINGRFEKPREVHRVRFAVKEGQRWRFQVEAESLGSHADGLLKVTDQAGKQLATADDAGVPPVAPGQPGTTTADPTLEFTVPKGVTGLRVELRDVHERGGVNFGYRLTIEPVEADFLLAQPALELNAPRGGLALVQVSVTRRGHQGPIQLGLSEVPRGWKVQGGYIPAAGGSGHFTVHAIDAQLKLPGPLAWRIEGKGDKLSRIAETNLVLSKDGNVAASMMPIDNLAVGLAEAPPFALQPPAAVELVNGYGVQVPVAVAWPTKPLANIEVTGLVPSNQGKPEPLAAAIKPDAATIDKKPAQMMLTAPINAPPGRSFDVVPQGKGKVNNQDVTVLGPAIAVNVRPPFTVDLAKVGPATPGQTSALKGKIQRHPLFKEAVQLKVDGLPSGVTLAMPLKPLPPTQADFQIDVKIDAKAAPATATLTLRASAAINGLAYSHPPLALPISIQAKK